MPNSKSEQFLLDRQKAYKQVFNKGGSGKLVMEDLKKFCRAEESCFDPDPRIHAVLEGRREVFLRISEHLDGSSEALFNKYIQGE